MAEEIGAPVGRVPADGDMAGDGEVAGGKGARQEARAGEALRSGALGLGSAGALQVALRDEALALCFAVDGEGAARLQCLAPASLAAQASGEGAASKGLGSEGAKGEMPKSEMAKSGKVMTPGLHLADVVTVVSGRSKSSGRYAESVTGGLLRYVAHVQRSDGPWQELEFELEEARSGLLVQVTYRVLSNVGVVCSWARLQNRGRLPVAVTSVTSLLAPGLAGPGGLLEDVELWWADNEWLGEDRWHSRAFRDALPDLGFEAHGGTDPRGMFGLTSIGSWPCGTYLPMGAAVNRQTGHTWLWQVEHNGAWHWQVGEKAVGGTRVGYLALLGPTDAQHQWRLVLGPGDDFCTVPAAVAVSAEGLEPAVAALTRYRRERRRPHEDHRRLPVIFNDYMNTLMGDPTTERLLPLVDAAARAGAEYFVIDAGWYAELGAHWWDTVGRWVPSTSRFPGGVEELLERVKMRGMVPGLWVEPEVVGVNSPVADELPPEAFFRRGGERVVENGRYQLDFSHPATRAHLDQAVDRLVDDLGVGYLKMDYNINIGPGTDGGDASAGAGLLAHNRAFLKWVQGLLDRHKNLTLESCASGAMRKDYATLSVFQLQSTSDQQDFLRYPAISVAAPMSLTPEQGAVWAYPQPGWGDDAITFAICNALLGRVHLSGHLDKMTELELQLVADGMAVYKTIRGDLAHAVPFWPLGLPRWDDEWFALGMRAPGASYLVVWHRGRLGGAQSEAPAPTLYVSHLQGRQVRPRVLYPLAGAALAGVDWHPSTGQLEVQLPHVPSACLLSLSEL